MFEEFFAAEQEERRKDALKYCANRCLAALEPILEQEEVAHAGTWAFDARLREFGIGVLYERFSYAMAIVAYRMRVEYASTYGELAALETSIGREVTLDVATGIAFEALTGMKPSGGVTAYSSSDYDPEECEIFWGAHANLRREIVEFRSSFSSSERTDLHGFPPDEDDSPSAGNEWAVLDFIHVRRALENSDGIDIARYLKVTKCDQAPAIVNTFMQQPARDYFAPKKRSWWKFWKTRDAETVG